MTGAVYNILRITALDASHQPEPAAAPRAHQPNPIATIAIDGLT